MLHDATTWRRRRRKLFKGHPSRTRGAAEATRKKTCGTRVQNHERETSTAGTRCFHYTMAKGGNPTLLSLCPAHDAPLISNRHSCDVVSQSRPVPSNRSPCVPRTAAPTTPFVAAYSHTSSPEACSFRGCGITRRQRRSGRQHPDIRQSPGAAGSCRGGAVA